MATVPQHSFLWSALDDMVYHKRRYRRAELVDRLREAGFEVRYVTSFLFLLFPAWVNLLFDAVMRLDEAMIGMHRPLPWGGSLLIIARNG